MLLELCKGEQRRVNLYAEILFGIKVSWEKLNPGTLVKAYLPSFSTHLLDSYYVQGHSLGGIGEKEIN